MQAILNDPFVTKLFVVVAQAPVVGNIYRSKLLEKYQIKSKDSQQEERKVVDLRRSHWMLEITWVFIISHMIWIEKSTYNKVAIYGLFHMAQVVSI